MGREFSRELRIILENMGIDVLHLLTLILILGVLSHYKDFKNWRKLDWNKKLWIGVTIYGLIIALTISILRIFRIVEL